jgi:hypothetical protein
MKTKKITLLFLLLLSVFVLPAQLENVRIETYYVSDANDATDTTGSVLPVNSTTYRVYIDMEPGCKLLKLFGDAEHELMFSGDSTFYNHTLEGQSHARFFNIARFGESTLALDTWLTLGQTSLSKPSGKTYFGTPKSLDRNGSIVGGVNNDGGSVPIDGGLLKNSAVAAGIPLTTADGLDTMSLIPVSSFEGGIVDLDGNDSTIFGSLVKKNSFVSKNAYLQSNGVMGVNRDSNLVLVAQLTTKGKISFALNVEILDKNGTTIHRYVAKNGADSTADNVHQRAFLNYPIPCGCTDPNYAEYSASFGCKDNSACKTYLVVGCGDSLACNYDAKVKVHVPILCCYPGLCGNRDIVEVCPKLAIGELNESVLFELFPNPVEEELLVKVKANALAPLNYLVYNGFGQLLLESNSGGSLIDKFETLDVSDLTAGLYFLRISAGKLYSTKKFVKH